MIAVQGKIGGIGEKATTVLGMSFDSLTSKYGLGKDGISRLNSVQPTPISFTLGTTDLGVDNRKNFRFLYVGCTTDNPFSISVEFDDGGWKTFQVSPKRNGLQRVRIPIGRALSGRYVRIKVESDFYIRVDSIEALVNTHPRGLS